MAGDVAADFGLPAVDKQICSFERWLVGHLADIADPDHAQFVRRFATWEVLPRLRTRAERKTITPASRRHAGDLVKAATALLQWLSEHGLTLATCRQADVDSWHVEHSEHSRNAIRTFLLWCIASKVAGCFRLPTARLRQPKPLPQHERVELLGRLLTDHDLPLRTRVAATIVLLCTACSAVSLALPSTMSSATATRSSGGSANHRPRSPARSPISCSAGSTTETT